MHISGKIALGLIVIATGAAFYLAGDLATKRNKHADKIAALKKTRDKNDTDLAAARITKSRLEDEVTRQMTDWGRQWTVEGQGNGQEASYVLNVGVAQGLAAQEVSLKKNQPVTVYLFAVPDETTSQYLGEFVVTQSEPQRTLVQLSRPAYPGEVGTWPQTGNFRVRERIPPGIRSIFHNLRTEQTMADQQVISETAKLNIQNKHIEDSQKTLELRLAELNGNMAAPSTAEPEISYGLVETLRTEEAERNAIALDVDALRRSLSDNYARLEKVLKENQAAVESISSQYSTETAQKPERLRTN